HPQRAPRGHRLAVAAVWRGEPRADASPRHPGARRAGARGRGGTARARRVLLCAQSRTAERTPPRLRRRAEPANRAGCHPPGGHHPNDPNWTNQTILTWSYPAVAASALLTARFTARQ